MRMVYVAGPYTAPTQEGIDANARRAAEAGQELIRRGYAVYCPHTMTHNWDHGTGLRYEHFIALCLEAVARCDMMYLLPGWEHSPGAVLEREHARELGKEVWYCCLPPPAQ